MNNQLLHIANIVATRKIDHTPAKATATDSNKGFSNSLREAERQAATRSENKTEAKEADAPTVTNARAENKVDSVDKSTQAQDKNTQAQADATTAQHTDEALVENASPDSVSVVSEADPALSQDTIAVGVLMSTKPSVSATEQLLNEESLLEEALHPSVLLDPTGNGQNSGATVALSPLANVVREALAAKPLSHSAESSAELKKASPLTALAQAFDAMTQDNNNSQTALGAGKTAVATVTQLAMNMDITDAVVAKNSFDGVFDKQVLNLLADEPALPKADTLIQRMAGDIPLASIANPAHLPMIAPTDKSQLSITIPFQQAQWSEAVAERVMWMSTKGIQEAEIQLDPPELGPLQVRVSVTNEQAQVSFVVQNASVRDALDQSAMRLREMFDAEGINLTDVDVSDQSQQQAGDDSSKAESGSAVGAGSNEEIATESPINSSSEGYSLVNTYA